MGRKGKKEEEGERELSDGELCQEYLWVGRTLPYRDESRDMS
jgi:hypothetical protein